MTHKDKRHFSENPSCRTAPGTFHPAFTIVELIIVIIVVAMLAAMTIFAFGSWRSRTATTEVTNAMSAIASAMKNELTFKNVYPTSIPSNYSGNSGVTVTYVSGDAANYCIEGVSKAVPSIKMFISSSNAKPQYGTCVSGAIAVDPNTLGSKVAWSAVTDRCAVGNFKTYCWGTNNFGQVGTGSTSATPVSKPVLTLSNSSALIASEEQGYKNSCATDGTDIYCWSGNQYGELGNGTTGTVTYLPTKVDTTGVLSGKVVTQITMGLESVCVLASGSIYCWGYNARGQLGDGTTVNRNIPVAVTMNGELAGKTVSSVEAGGSTVCAIAGNQVYCWGSNQYGELGTGVTSPTGVQSVPTAATAVNATVAGKTITKLSMSSQGGCVLASGQVYCWGANWYGELGDGITPTGFGNAAAIRLAPSPVDTTGVLSGKTVTDLSKGYGHTCVIADSKPYCWGANSLNGTGALGNNSTAMSTVPVAVDTSGVLAGKVVTKIHASNGKTCALASIELFCWGGEINGTLGNGATTNSLVPVAVLQP